MEKKVQSHHEEDLFDASSNQLTDKGVAVVLRLNEENIFNKQFSGEHFDDISELLKKKGESWFDDQGALRPVDELKRILIFRLDLFTAALKMKVSVEDINVDEDYEPDIFANYLKEFEKCSQATFFSSLFDDFIDVFSRNNFEHLTLEKEKSLLVYIKKWGNELLNNSGVEELEFFKENITKLRDNSTLSESEQSYYYSLLKDVGYERYFFKDKNIDDFTVSLNVFIDREIIDQTSFFKSQENLDFLMGKLDLWEDIILDLYKSSLETSFETLKLLYEQIVYLKENSKDPEFTGHLRYFMNSIFPKGMPSEKQILVLSEKNVLQEKATERHDFIESWNVAEGILISLKKNVYRFDEHGVWRGENVLEGLFEPFYNFEKTLEELHHDYVLDDLLIRVRVYLDLLKEIEDCVEVDVGAIYRVLKECLEYVRSLYRPTYEKEEISPIEKKFKILLNKIEKEI